MRVMDRKEMGGVWATRDLQLGNAEATLHLDYVAAISRDPRWFCFRYHLVFLLGGRGSDISSSLV